MSHKQETHFLELAITNIALAQRELAVTEQSVNDYVSILSDLQSRYHKITGHYYHVDKTQLRPERDTMQTQADTRCGSHREFRWE